MASFYSRVSEEIKKLDLNNPNIKIDIEEVMQDVAKESINEFAGKYSMINDKEIFSE